MERRFKVFPYMVSIFAGSGDVPVLGTPFALALAENVCLEMVKNGLKESETTVGVYAEINHISAIKPGGEAIVKAEIISSTDRKFEFQFEIYSQDKLIAKGKHIRVKVDRKRFELDKIPEDILYETLDSIKVIGSIDLEAVFLAGEIISEGIKSGGKVLVFGNGGSAADAQHFCAELVGRFKKQREGIPAIALTTDTSSLTAIGNDFGFEYIFERQISALGKKVDVALGISTSGKSKNVLRGLQKAKEIGMKTVFLTGMGGKDEIWDVVVSVPSYDTQRIQEAHQLILHLIAGIVEKNIEKKGD